MQKQIMLTLFLACGTAQAESIPLVREHGMFVVPVVINGKITLNFTIDSGASDVSIPADVFSTLTRDGTVSQEDFLDEELHELTAALNKNPSGFVLDRYRLVAWWFTMSLLRQLHPLDHCC